MLLFHGPHFEQQGFSDSVLEEHSQRSSTEHLDLESDPRVSVLSLSLLAPWAGRSLSVSEPQFTRL